MSRIAIIVGTFPRCPPSADCPAKERRTALWSSCRKRCRRAMASRNSKNANVEPSSCLLYLSFSGTGTRQVPEIHRRGRRGSQRRIAEITRTSAVLSVLCGDSSSRLSGSCFGPDSYGQAIRVSLTRSAGISHAFLPRVGDVETFPTKNDFTAFIFTALGLGSRPTLFSGA